MSAINLLNLMINDGNNNADINNKIEELKRMIINNDTTKDNSQLDLKNNEQIEKAFVLFKQILNEDLSKNDELTDMINNKKPNLHCKLNDQKVNNAKSNINSSLIQDSNRNKSQKPRQASKNKYNSKLSFNSKDNNSQPQYLQLNLSPSTSRYSSKKRYTPMSPVSISNKRIYNIPMTPQSGHSKRIIAHEDNKGDKASSNKNIKNKITHYTSITKQATNALIITRKKNYSPDNLNDVYKSIENKHLENRLQRKQQRILIQQETSKLKDSTISITK